MGMEVLCAEERGRTYGSDYSVPDVSDADLSHRAAEPQVTTLCN